MNYDLWKCTDEMAERAEYLEAMEELDINWREELERRKADAFLDNENNETN